LCAGLTTQLLSKSAWGFGRLKRLPDDICHSPLASARWLVCLTISSLLALCGCTQIKVKLGMSVYLEKTPVASMQASLPKGPAIAPGEKSPLVVQFTQPDGKVLVTEGRGKGKVLWADLTVTPTVVTVYKKGILRLAHDPRVSDGKTAHVTISVPSHPGLHADLDIPTTYDYSFVSNFSGSPGSSGFNGTDGTNGASGTMGSIDPNNPSPGGDGGNGTDGSNGQDGGNGGDAPPVQLRVALRAGTHPLLQVSVSAAGKRRLYLVDPQGGALTVKADGGPAGTGGRGGRGGQGGSGGAGSPSGSSGTAGSDGRNGFDGSPGKGGSITVTYDPQTKPFLGSIHLSNHGGPPPVFKEEPVAPLW
ncbi:MAG: hypothetical protein ACREP9_01585, partial [Candidatus Dormibacteraceae bacterium]